MKLFRLDFLSVYNILNFVRWVGEHTFHDRSAVLLTAQRQRGPDLAAAITHQPDAKAFRKRFFRLEAKAAWRATGGGRGPRVPAKGAVLASYMGAEEVVGPLSLLDEEGLVAAAASKCSPPCAYIAHISFGSLRTITAFASLSAATTGVSTLAMKAQLPSQSSRTT